MYMLKGMENFHFYNSVRLLRLCLMLKVESVVRWNFSIVWSVKQGLWKNAKYKSSHTVQATRNSRVLCGIVVNEIQFIVHINPFNFFSLKYR